MTHLTETEAQKVGADAAMAIPDHIVEAAKKVVIDDLGIDIPGSLQEVYIDVIADAIAAALLAERERYRWQPIETADKDDEHLMLGIVRQGIMQEIHIGGYRYAYNEDEVSCWWSDQADDEIVPTHWARLVPVDAAPNAEG